MGRTSEAGVPKDDILGAGAPSGSVAETKGEYPVTTPGDESIGAELGLSDTAPPFPAAHDKLTAEGGRRKNRKSLSIKELCNLYPWKKILPLTSWFLYASAIYMACSNVLWYNILHRTDPLLHAILFVGASATLPMIFKRVSKTNPAVENIFFGFYKGAMLFYFTKVVMYIPRFHRDLFIRGFTGITASMLSIALMAGPYVFSLLTGGKYHEVMQAYLDKNLM